VLSISNESFHTQYQEKYGQCINIEGNADKADHICRAIAKYNFEKIELANKTGRKLYYSANWIIDRVGELFDQGATVANYQQWGWLNHKPLFFAPDLKEIFENNAWLSDVFELVDAKKHQPSKNDIPFSLQFHQTPVSPANICGVNCCLADEFNFNNGFDRFPLLSILKRCATPARIMSGRYVVLHSRAEGFFDSDHHAYRNPSIQSLRLVTEELLNAGFSVVRIGHSQMPSLDLDHPNFFDLTAEKRTQSTDISLIFHAEFFVGNASGPMSVASQLGKKILMFDSFPTGHIRHNTHHILRDFTDGNGNPVTFYDLVYGEFRGLYSPVALATKNITVSQPSANVIAKQTNLFVEGKIPATHKWIENRSASFSQIPC
jgi:putative glycosyltransferase (TIGR04372 family)